MRHRIVVVDDKRVPWALEVHVRCFPAILRDLAEYSHGRDPGHLIPLQQFGFGEVKGIAPKPYLAHQLARAIVARKTATVRPRKAKENQ